MSSDDQPRLPLEMPPSPGLPALPSELPSELPVAGRAVVPLGAAHDVEIRAFVEPTLLDMDGRDRALRIARGLPLLWAIAVGVTVLVARARLRDGSTAGDGLRVVGYVGVGVAVVVTIVGWVWTDRRTRNAKLLDGRRPTRLRCATAWLLSGSMVVLAWLAVSNTEPTETVDIRPAVMALVFLTAAWRPYALLRRLNQTLSRLSADSLIVPAYLLDVAGFGLLWWQLAELPDRLTPAESGRTDVLVGVAFAAVVAFGLNLLFWHMIVHAISVAEAHRLVSQRTRHEHRELRLRGVDPTDPHVWWTLVQRRLAEEEELLAREAGVDDDAGVPTAELGTATDPSTVEALRSRVLGLPTVDPDTAVDDIDDIDDIDEPDDDEGVEEPAVIEDDEEPAAIDDDEVDDDEEDVDDDLAVGEIEEPAAARRGGYSTEEFATSFARRHGPAIRRMGPERTGELVERLSEQFSNALGGAGADPDDLRSRLEAALHQGGGGRDPLASLRSRLGVSEPPPSRTARQESIDRLLHQAGELQVEEALGRRRRDDDGERMVPPKLYALEASRYLMLVALGAVVGLAVWMMTRMITIGTDATLMIVDADDVQRLDEARRVVLLGLSIALVTVPLWAMSLTNHATRAGVPDLSGRRNLALFVVAAVVAAVRAPIADDDLLGFGLIALQIAIVVVSARSVLPARDWYGLSDTRHRTWVWMLPVVLSALAIERASAGSGADSLDVMTFCGVIAIVAGAIAVALAAVSTADIEDEIRLTPELAVAARPKRR